MEAESGLLSRLSRAAGGGQVMPSNGWRPLGIPLKQLQKGVVSSQKKNNTPIWNKLENQ